MTLLNANGDKVTPINERQLKRELAQNATVGEVLDLSHDVARQVVNNVMNQAPDMVDQRIAEAMAAFLEVIESKYVLTPREKPDAT